MKTSYMLENPSRPNDFLPLSNRLWEALSIEGLDSQFIGIQAEEAVAKWSRNFTDIDLGERTITVNAQANINETENALSFIESTFTPGSEWNFCIVIALDKAKAEKIIRMPCRLENVTFSRWQQERRIAIAFQAVEPWFTTACKSASTGGSSVYINLVEYTSIPAPFWVKIVTSNNPVYEKNIKMNFKISNKITGDTIREYSVPLLNLKTPSFTFEIDSNDIIGKSRYNGTALMQQIVWKNARNLPSRILKNHDEMVTITIGYDGDATAIGMESTDRIEYQRFITAPAEEPSIINAEAYTPNLVPENIKAGVTILGVYGTLKGDGEFCYPLYKGPVDVYPSTKVQSLATYKKSMEESILIYPVTAKIDPNITPANIKKGVTILGITGTAEGAGGKLPDYTGETTVEPLRYPQELETAGKSVNQNIVIKGVSSSIDKNIKPENIRLGYSILGVKGKYTGDYKNNGIKIGQNLQGDTNGIDMTLTIMNNKDCPFSLSANHPGKTTIAIDKFVDRVNLVGGWTSTHQIQNYTTTLTIKSDATQISYLPVVSFTGVNSTPFFWMFDTPITCDFTGVKFGPHVNADGTVDPMQFILTSGGSAGALPTNAVQNYSRFWDNNACIFSAICSNCETRASEWVMKLTMAGQNPFSRWSAEDVADFKGQMKSRYNCKVVANFWK